MIWIYFITHFDPYIMPYNFLQLLFYYLICQNNFQNTRPALTKTFWLLFQAINLLAQEHFCDQFKIDKKVLTTCKITGKTGLTGASSHLIYTFHLSLSNDQNMFTICLYYPALISTNKLQKRAILKHILFCI